MHSTIGIDIAAPPELVYRLARDVTRWSRILPHYVRSRVVSREPDGVLVCDFVARRPFVPLLGLGLPVTWRSRTWDEPAARRLRFVHVAGATKGMDVTWTIDLVARPNGAPGTRVEIAHDFAPAIPGFAWFVDRFFTRPIAGRTLATFRALAEAVADDVERIAVTDGVKATAVTDGVKPAVVPDGRSAIGARDDASEPTLTTNT